MSWPSPKPDILPRPSEVAGGIRKWQQQLEAIHTHHDTVKQADHTAFEAEREAIVVSVKEKRVEQMARLNEEIHRYMQMVQADMDALLEEWQAEKLQRLEKEYTTQREKRDQARDQCLLDHLKIYISAMETPLDSVSVFHSTSLYRSRSGYACFSRDLTTQRRMLATRPGLRSPPMNNRLRQKYLTNNLRRSLS